MVKDHAIKVARDYARIENIPHVAADRKSTRLNSSH